MRNPFYIEFYQERTFGELINATFEFLRLNVRTLGSILLQLSLPAVFFAAFVLNGLQEALGNTPDAQEDLPAALLYIFLLLITFNVSVAAVLGVLYEWMKEYRATGGRVEMSLSVCWSRMKPHVLPLAITTFLHLGILVVATLPVALLFGLLSSALANTGGFFLLAFLLFLAIFALFTVLSTPLLLMYPMQIFENLSYVQALRRAFRLVYPHHKYEVAGLVVVIFIIYYAIQLIFVLPFQLITLYLSLHESELLFGEWIQASTYAFSMLGYYLTLPIFWVAMGLQYFSLVEKYEMIGLKQKIEQIGQ